MGLDNCCYDEQDILRRKRDCPLYRNCRLDLESRIAYFVELGFDPLIGITLKKGVFIRCLNVKKLIKKLLIIHYNNTL